MYATLTTVGWCLDSEGGSTIILGAPRPQYGRRILYGTADVPLSACPFSSRRVDDETRGQSGDTAEQNNLTRKFPVIISQGPITLRFPRHKNRVRLV